MGQMRIVGRRGRGRCAYCREALGEEGTVPCADCGVSLHAECWDELGGCPTLGCAAAAPRAQRRREELREAPRTWAAAPGLAGFGRVTRTPPGPLARFGPYSRMVVRSVWHSAILLALTGGLAYGVINAGPVGRIFKRSPVVSLLLLLTAGVFAFLAVDWLRRLPAFWRRVGQLLDDGQVTPMHFATFTTGSGKSKTLNVRLTAPDERLREFSAAGILSPMWLALRSGQTVYVHGVRDDEPCLVEFQDGTLALFDTGPD